MKELRPIRERLSDYDEIEDEIIRLLREEIYVPILSEMGAVGDGVLRNSIEDLADAIRDSRISFEHGRFTGKFSSTISKELKKIGAKWEAKTKSYRLTSDKLPPEILSHIAQSKSRFESILTRIDKKLESLSPEEISEKISLQKSFDKTLWKVDSELNKTMKAVTVTPQLTRSRAKIIADDYTNNMKLYIQEWTQKSIKDLRQKMRDRSYEGLRYEGIIKEIQSSYGVSKRKAKFLARQETSLMITSFKQERYKESGISQYKWRCVSGTKLHPVRPMHKKLDGKIFSFDDPPVTSPNGSRNNPGRDFNCRCTAIPIVKF